MYTPPYQIAFTVDAIPNLCQSKQSYGCRSLCLAELKVTEVAHTVWVLWLWLTKLPQSSSSDRPMQRDAILRTVWVIHFVSFHIMLKYRPTRIKTKILMIYLVCLPISAMTQSTKWLILSQFIWNHVKLEFLTMIIYVKSNYIRWNALNVECLCSRK